MIRAIQHILLLLLTCACFNTQAQVNIITTIAGSDSAGFSGDSGPAIIAKLNWPNQICFDPGGNICIVDGFNHRIRKYDKTTGIITTIAGVDTPGFSGDGNLATNTAFFVPSGIATDFDGNIFISDAGNRRIRKIMASTGLVMTIAGTGVVGNSGDGGPAVNALIDGPSGICTDKFGNVYFADYHNNNVRKIDALTGIITSVAGTGAWGYSGDDGPATNAKLYGPFDVFVDSSMNVFFTDSWNSVVRRVDGVSGIISTIAGKGTSGYSGDGGPAKDAQMEEPAGIFVDTGGDIFVADYRNGAIRKIEALTNKISTVAGGDVGYGGDGGPATNAKLKCVDILEDNFGNLYISDYVNCRIRKVNNAVAVNGINKEIESKLYPNPTKGIFTIQAPIVISHVNIYNIAGLRVYERTCTTTETEIDITSLPSGVYMVYVQCGDKQYVSKMVKE